MNTELYDTLGVDLPASADDIKAAYRKAAKQHHPDAGGDAERFGEIQKAYDVLSDPDRRARYDATGATDTMDRGTRIEAMARELFGSMLIGTLQSTDPLSSFGHNWITQALARVEADRRRLEAERKTIEGKKALADKLEVSARLEVMLKEYDFEADDIPVFDRRAEARHFFNDPYRQQWGKWE